VAPTLLQWGGAPAEGLDVGLLGGEGPGGAWLLENEDVYYSCRWRALRGIVADGYLLIDGARPRLFRLDDDPLRDRAAEDADRVAALRAMRSERMQAEKPRGWHRPLGFEPAEAEALARLGYSVPGGGGASDSPDLPDPLERRDDLVLRSQALHGLVKARQEAGYDMLLTGQLAKSTQAERMADREKMKAPLQAAMERVEELKTRNPADPAVPFLSGMVLASLQNYGAAVNSLVRAVVATPFSAELRYNFAVCLMRAGQPLFAESEMNRAVTLDPRFLPAYRWFIAYYAQQKSFGLSAWWFHRLESGWEESAAIVANMHRARAKVEDGLESFGQEIREPEGFPAPSLLPEGLRTKVEE